jgi:hypothetical protein
MEWAAADWELIGLTLGSDVEIGGTLVWISLDLESCGGSRTTTVLTGASENEVGNLISWFSFSGAVGILCRDECRGGGHEEDAGDAHVEIW